MSKHLDDLIDQWHEGDSNKPLHEFLGMTKDEFAAWVTQRSNSRNEAKIKALKKYGITAKTKHHVYDYLYESILAAMDDYAEARDKDRTGILSDDRKKDIGESLGRRHRPNHHLKTKSICSPPTKKR